MTASSVTSAFSGIGLHPPGMPTDCGLMGAAQFLQITPCALVEADRPADFAGVKNRRNFAVGLLIKEEAHFESMFGGGEAVQVAVIDRLQREWKSCR